jgi:lipopolysaccharide/colanic/teichoic acid biosynthesis glycosyltransferase
MKRLFDIVVALIALLLLSPLLLLIALAVAASSSGGAFFRQVRVGKGGREFRLLKFRSMRIGSEAKGQLTVGGRDPRITPMGLVLRRTKLDELPQLWNILVGDMSFVGPRPEVPRYVAHYSMEQRQVLSVRPGLTGAASVEYIDENEVLGRAADPERAYIEKVMPAKLALDLRYVRERSLLLDLRIMLATAARLLRR